LSSSLFVCRCIKIIAFDCLTSVCFLDLKAEGIMKHQSSTKNTQTNKSVELAPRTFYRPDSDCSEYGSWYFSTAELGEVGPFDSREEAKEALEMSLYLDGKKASGKSAKKKKQIH